MNEWRNYQEAQQFKTQTNSQIDGINYGRVIAFYQYGGSLTDWVKRAVFSLFYSPRLTATEHGSDTLVYYSFRSKRRSDYDYMHDRLVGLTDGHADVAESAECFSAQQFFRTLGSFWVAWRATSGQRFVLPRRLSITLLIAKYRSNADQFRALALGRRRLITFCDAAPTDNLLTQLANSEGARTITVQHGQYRLLNHDNMSPDAEAYANFVSDCLLAWGEATRAEFCRFGIPADRVKVTGWIRPWEVPTERHSGSPRRFGVMLNGANGAESNRALLQTAEKVADHLGIKCIIRLHPSFSVDVPRGGHWYESVRIYSTSEYLAKVDFSIAHMSGATIEMLCAGSPVYVLDDGLLADAFRVDGLCYRTPEEILRSVEADFSASSPDRARFGALARWFNDDRDQDQRILEAIYSERGR